MEKIKAIFLDRDGVINVEKNYLYKIEDFQFIDGVIEALQYLQKIGFSLFIITNQSGIGRGYYTQNDFDILTQWMVDQLEQKNIKIKQVECCPHSPNDDCRCRKPNTLMIENIAKNFNIDFQNSWLIGDKISDIECANNAGIKNTIQVRSGHNFETSIAQYIIDSLNLDEISKIINN